MFKKVKFSLAIIPLLFLLGCTDKELENKNRELNISVNFLKNENQRLSTQLKEISIKLGAEQSQNNKTKEAIEYELRPEFRKKIEAEVEEDDNQKWIVIFGNIAFAIIIIVIFLFVLLKSIKNKYDSKIENLKNKYESEFDIIKSKYEKDKYTLDKELEGFRNNRNLQEEEIRTRLELGKELEKIKKNLELNFNIKDIKND